MLDRFTRMSLKFVFFRFEASRDHRNLFGEQAPASPGFVHARPRFRSVICRASWSLKKGCSKT
ncbi:MAG TPA: hypothetical protein VGM29_01735, partial [Polyangiaceae bacterium]